MVTIKTISRKSLRRIETSTAQSILYQSIKNCSLKSIKNALNLGIDQNVAISVAIKKNNLKALKIILTHNKNIKKIPLPNHLAIKAALCQDFEIIKYLVENNWIGYDYLDHSVLTAVSMAGKTKTVEFLLKYDKFSPTNDQQNAIMGASYYGRTEVVKLLLKDKRVNPIFGFNSAINKASERGHKEVFYLLLDDYRVNSTLTTYQIEHLIRVLNEKIIKLRKDKIKEFLESE